MFPNRLKQAALAAAILSVCAGPAIAGIELLPHRAIYGVMLESVKQGSGIASVTGELLADWSESCAGWSLDHRSRLDVTYETGQSIQLTVSVATWESRDGLDYRFNISNSANGRVSDRIEGRATLPAAGRPGNVTYDEPEGRTETLPAGTVFPMTHSLRILQAAQKAPTFLTVPVFDGMTLEGAFSISAFLGKATKPTSPPEPTLAALEKRRSWPLRMAFYPVAGNAAEPDHEIGMLMYDNGVGDNLMLDFGSFTVRANLISLKMNERPSCGA